MSTVGRLQGRFDFVRFGTGPDPLVVLPGLVFDNPPPSRTAAQAYGLGLRRLAEGRTVTVLERPRGVVRQVPRDDNGAPLLETADLADVYAPVIAKDLGPVDVLAFSTGGLVAQHLALRHPALVRRLVLVITGARIAEAGRQLCQTWQILAKQQDWRRLRGSLAASAVDGPVARRVAHLLRRSGRTPDTHDVADFRATLAAVLRHDTTEALPQIAAPTLVLGGRDDPFFPEPVLRATAAQLQDARVEVHRGGHGLPKHHSRWLQDRVTAFLHQTAEGR